MRGRQLLLALVAAASVAAALAAEGGEGSLVEVKVDAVDEVASPSTRLCVGVAGLCTSARFKSAFEQCCARVEGGSGPPDYKAFLACIGL